MVIDLYRCRYLAIILVLLSTFASACGEKKEGRAEKAEKKDTGTGMEIKPPSFDNSLPGEDGMKNAVLGYNQAVVDAYVSDRHVKFLRMFATEKETRRMFIFITTDRERDYAMAMRLNKLNFDNISTSEKLNLIDTSENWDFHYINYKTGKPVEPVKEMRYKLRYTLVKENAKWMIDKIEKRETTLIGEYSPPRWSLSGK